MPMDFVTTAPQPDSSMRTRDGPVSSMMPDATIPGFSRETAPTEVLRDDMDFSILDAFIILACAI